MTKYFFSSTIKIDIKDQIFKKEILYKEMILDIIHTFKMIFAKMFSEIAYKKVFNN